MQPVGSNSIRQHAHENSRGRCRPDNIGTKKVMFFYMVLNMFCFHCSFTKVKPLKISFGFEKLHVCFVETNVVQRFKRYFHGVFSVLTAQASSEAIQLCSHPCSMESKYAQHRERRDGPG